MAGGCGAGALLQPGSVAEVVPTPPPGSISSCSRPPLAPSSTAFLAGPAAWSSLRKGTQQHIKHVSLDWSSFNGTDMPAWAASMQCVHPLSRQQRQLAALDAPGAAAAAHPAPCKRPIGKNPHQSLRPL